MSTSFSPIDEQAIRALVREEIAADELRRIEEGQANPCPTCGCVAGRRVPGTKPPLPGTQYYTVVDGVLR